MIFTGNIEGVVADVRVQPTATDEAADVQKAVEDFAVEALEWCGPERWADFFKIGLLRGSPMSATEAADIGIQAMYARFRETEE